MRFIVSNISIGMFDNKQFNLNVREINEKEFRRLRFGCESRIGHLDVAEMTGIPFNREPVHLRVGDQLLLVQLYHGTLKFFEIRVEKA